MTSKRKMGLYYLAKIAFVCLLVLLILPAFASAYGQATYYSQSSYYGQGSYYGEPTYYSQPAYYTEGSYYSEAGYDITFGTDVRVLYDVSVTGSISKEAGTFVIDHPLDPQNKLLYHSFVESPDAKNLYDGIVSLDNKGSARIELPDYFEALNDNFRFLLTPLYQPMPELHIEEEVIDNVFVVGGGVPDGSVSWQVTGIRKDPYIKANPIVNEVKKSADTVVGRGEFLSDEAEVAFEADQTLLDAWFAKIGTITHNIWQFVTNPTTE